MNDAEKEALRASNGKVWKQDECFQNIAEAKAQKKELDKRSDQLKGEYGNKDRVQADLRELTEKYNTLELQVVKQTPFKGPFYKLSQLNQSYRFFFLSSIVTKNTMYLIHMNKSIH